MTQMIMGKSLSDWLADCPPLDDVVRLRETTWFNPALLPAAEGLAAVGLTAVDIDDAADRLKRFAPYLA